MTMLKGCGNPEQGNMYGFTVQNWMARLAGFPREDSFAYDEKRRIACVADGITRDFSDGTCVTHDFKGFIKSKRGLYSNHAQKVSGICVRIFMETMSLEEANREIWPYNMNHGLIPSNYTDKDLAGCVAAGAYAENGKINWQFIADSGIAISDKDGNIIFKTRDKGPHSREKNPYLEKIIKNNGGDWINPEARAIIRSQYRNNPKEPYAYGALTGEKIALQYIRKGTQGVDFGDYVLLFTDGIRNLLFPKNEKGEEVMGIREEYLNKILTGDFKGLEKLCRRNISTEGTLVVWKVE